MTNDTQTTPTRKPPKSWRVCPHCYGRATKLFNLSTGKYTCQHCVTGFMPAPILSLLVTYHSAAHIRQIVWERREQMRRMRSLYFTMDEIAAHWGVDRVTIYQHFQKHQKPANRVAPVVAWMNDDCDLKALANHKHQARRAEYLERLRK